MLELEWPCGVREGLSRFYVGKLPDAALKARECGTGKFLCLIVRDEAPRHGIRALRPGCEDVNLRMFELKKRYRGWGGGSLPIHDTLTVAEARRDIMLLTGIPVADWASGAGVHRTPRVLPGQDGWASLRELFLFLNETEPYVVIRNEETLPDSYPWDKHRDIDLLVDNTAETAILLNARRRTWHGYVYSETRVGSRDVLIHPSGVGDGYLDEAWERDILRTRVLSPRGVYLPSDENTFYALVYHCAIQKQHVRSDYPAPAARLAARLGLPGRSFDDWFAALESFLGRNGYRLADQDLGIRARERAGLADWRAAAAGVRDLCGVESARSFGLEELSHEPRTRTTRCVLAGTWRGQRAFVRLLTDAASLAAGAFAACGRVHGAAPDLVPRPFCWHACRAGAYEVEALVPGRPLATLADGGTCPPARADRIAADAVRIADALAAAGVVHRDIRPENLVVAEDGATRLTGFHFAVIRSQYRQEPRFLRHHWKDRLAMLGGDFAAGHGYWNDAHSLAACLAVLPATDGVVRARAELARRAAGPGTGLRVRLPGGLRLGLLFFLLSRSLAAALRPGRRSSPAFRARLAFCRTALVKD